jgi:hypothetical protein
MSEFLLKDIFSEADRKSLLGDLGFRLRRGPLRDIPEGSGTSQCYKELGARLMDCRKPTPWPESYITRKRYGCYHVLEQTDGFQVLCDYSKYFSSTDTPAALKRL